MKFEDVEDEYIRLWNSAHIREDYKDDVEWYLMRLISNEGRYKSVESTTHIPWYVIGAIHALESGFSFSRHLHNGDPLTKRTINVPSGRPISGSPPFAWEESAQDALDMAKDRVESPPSLAGWLYFLERYNGTGYRYRGINTPYLWSFTNHYEKGKYYADGRFSPTMVSKQAGACALFLGLIEKDYVLFDSRKSDPKNEVIFRLDNVMSELDALRESIYRGLI